MHMLVNFFCSRSYSQILVSVCAMSVRAFVSSERGSEREQEKKQMYRYSEFRLKWSNFSNRNKWTICMNEWNEWGETDKKLDLFYFRFHFYFASFAQHIKLCVYIL